MRTRSQAAPILLHGETDATWEQRTAASKLSMVAKEAAYRLEGVADTLYALAMLAGYRGNELAFIAAAIKDLSLSLRQARDAAWEEQEAAEQAAFRQRRCRPPVEAKAEEASA